MSFLRQEPNGVYVFKTGGSEVRATCLYTQLAALRVQFAQLSCDYSPWVKINYELSK